MSDERARFRDLIERDEIAVASGAHDPLTARIVDYVDAVDCIYMTGWGTSIARTGLPDSGAWTMTEMTEIMSNVTDVVSMPVFADADDGFGDGLDAARTTRKCIKAGLAGIHIEDERPPKPLVPGTEVLPIETAANKIAAAAEVRDDLDDKFTIIARSMAHYPAQFGDAEMDDPIGEAIRRVEAYYEAGADVVTLTMDSREKYERVCDEIGHLPLLVTANFARLEPEEFEELDVDIVMYPATSTLATFIGVYEYQSKLAESPAGTTDELYEELDSLPVTVEDIIGYNEQLERVEEYMPYQLSDLEDTGTF